MPVYQKLFEVVIIDENGEEQMLNIVAKDISSLIIKMSAQLCIGEHTIKKLEVAYSEVVI